MDEIIAKLKILGWTMIGLGVLGLFFLGALPVMDKVGLMDWTYPNSKKIWANRLADAGGNVQGHPDLMSLRDSSPPGAFPEIQQMAAPIIQARSDRAVAAQQYAVQQDEEEQRSRAISIAKETILNNLHNKEKYSWGDSRIEGEDAETYSVFVEVTAPTRKGGEGTGRIIATIDKGSLRCTSLTDNYDTGVLVATIVY